METKKISVLKEELAKCEKMKLENEKKWDELKKKIYEKEIEDRENEKKCNEYKEKYEKLFRENGIYEGDYTMDICSDGSITVRVPDVDEYVDIDEDGKGSVHFTWYDYKQDTHRVRTEGPLYGGIYGVMLYIKHYKEHGGPVFAEGICGYRIDGYHRPV